MVKAVHFLMLAVIFFPLSGFAQGGDVKISGRVLDEKTQEPVIGANVSLVGEKSGTVSNVDGSFSLSVRSLPATISVDFLGYKRQEVDVYETAEQIIVQLGESANFLNEIVVVGYGTQKRKELTGAISSVSAEALKLPVTSFDQVLNGAAPGIVVNQNSGQPGASSTIRIRGGNSINGGNEPLYVIDGLIVYNDNNNSRTNSGAALPSYGSIDANINLLSTINPADIEAIEILKDASATAIYGTRGANGVIIISTKKGRRGSNSVSYQVSAGWSEIAKKPNLLNGPQWWAFYRDIVGDDAVKSIEQTAQGKFDANQTFDWVGEGLQTGLTQDHQVSVRGGDVKGRYSVSGNYVSQDGILRNTDYERYSARINLDREVFKNFRIGANALGSHSKQNSLGSYDSNVGINSWVSILRASPVVPIYNQDGTYNHSNPFNIANPEANPVADLLTTTSETNVNRLIGNFFGELKILPSLTAKVNLGADLLNSNQNYYAPKEAIGGHRSNGYASKGSKTANSWQSEFTLNYDKTIAGIHHIDALVGYTFQRSDIEYGNAVATNFPNESTRQNSLQSGTASAPYSGAETNVLLSGLGRVNYTLRDRYNLTATLRADASSHFGPNNRRAYFPSLGLSWNVNNEPFLKAYKKISNLKLRLSAGVTGNQEIPAYLYENTLLPVNYSDGSNLAIGFIPGKTKPNPDLKWESTAQYNAGADFGLLNDRITAVLDLYYKKTSDLLLLLPLASTDGYDNIYSNAGSASNRGVEAGLNVHVVKSKNFNYYTGLNFSRNINEVLDLGGLDEIQPPFAIAEGHYPTIVRPGLPLGTFYGYEFVGVSQDGNVPRASWIDRDPQAGYPIYVDHTGDGNITNEDKVALGNAQPDFTVGFNNTFSYKQWDASFYLSASVGNKLYNALENKLNTPYPSFNASAQQLDRWTTAHWSTETPQAVTTNAFVLDSRFIEDASYLRLKNLVVGYTLPFHIRGLNQKSSLRLFATAQNLLTLTKYKGFDPEASRVGNATLEQNSLYQGIDYGAYPSARTFLFGINVNL
jgi:TonB-linked SusC/RagA family outer membrane protein